MASVTFSFNLDPVASGAAQSAATPSAASNSAVAAKYEAAQVGFQDQSAMAGVSSPACEPGGCFVVHGEGPGVTTLSIGEEGGGAGDFIALPVLDGVGFLEPPAPSFVGVADFNITLAIGEEGGGGATSVAEIGAGASPAAASQQFTMEPVYGSSEIGVVAPAQTAQADLSPIQTSPIVEPRAKPENAMTVAAAPSADVASAQPPVSPIEAGSIAEPRAKPETLTSFSFPMPDMKPEAIASSGAGTGESSTGNYVSVGDYDSYVASLGGGDAAGSTELAGSAVAVETPVSEAATPATPSSVEVTYSAPPSAPDVAAPISAESTSTAPPPVADVAAPQGVETMAQPVAAAPIETVPDVLVTPKMKPASFTMPGPASLAPIQTVPIDTVPIYTAPAPVAGETAAVIPQAQPVAETGVTFATVDGPVPVGKPEGASVEAPRLSDDDFRITTLAYGEEDAGGG